MGAHMACSRLVRTKKDVDDARLAPRDCTHVVKEPIQEMFCFVDGNFLVCVAHCVLATHTLSMQDSLDFRSLRLHYSF